MHDIWERNKSEWFTIYVTRFFLEARFERDNN